MRPHDAPPPFQPLPFLGNAHVQTVLGAFLMPARPRRQARSLFLPLPDGDALALHVTTPRHWRTGDPLAILVHGLGGCHRSSYMIRVTNLLVARGIRTIAVDLRGAGMGARRASRLYNAACSDDIRAVAERCRTLFPASPLYLVGFSLGGNIVLKLAGEAAISPLPNLAAVAAVAPPIDLLRCSALIQSFPLYDRFFVRHLLAQVRRHQQLNPHLPTVAFPKRLTLRGFDDIYTAPRGGFRDAADYYQKASALPLVASIPVPALLLTARDDPFVCASPFETLTPRTGLQIHIAPGGGHLGFLGWDGAGGVRWAERFVVEWIAAKRLRFAPP